MAETQNPLAKHFRVPAIHIKLPSNGEHWPEGSLNLPVTGELPVFPMTTRDEINIRTPDALLNGSGVVNVIQSCIPSIVDAWKMPAPDVDAVLIAIRIASYSNIMDIETKCPHCKEENNYGVDLNNVAASITYPKFSTEHVIDGLTFKFRPQQYFEVNKTNLVNFEEQKLLNIISNTEISDDEKTEKFTAHLARLCDLNNQVYVNSIDYIMLPDGQKVSDQAFLVEYFRNVDRKVVSKIKEIIEGFNADTSIKPVSVVCNDCNEPFNVALTFDYATFFV
jgi:hypothetical protein